MKKFAMTAVACALVCMAGSAALAGSAPMKPSGSGIVARPLGVVSLSALARSPANAAMLQALRNAKPVEMPRHRLPNGGSTDKAPAFLPRMTTVTNGVAGNTRLHSPPGSITGFTGIYEGSNLAATGGELEPPDQGMAVNNGEVVEIVNNTIQIFDSSGHAITSPLANATFFGSGSDALSDPHAVFDPTTQRWFVEELRWNGTEFGFALAISLTSDPTGSYYIYFIDDSTGSISGCGGSGRECLPDYPQVGFDANGFYIAADLFANGGGGGFVDAAFYALPKAALEAGAGFSYVYFLLPDFVVQPAIPAPGQAFVSAVGGTEYALTARNIYDGSTNVRLWAFSHTNKLATHPTELTANGVDIGAESYGGTTPSTQPDVIGPYGTSLGATSAPQLDGGYNSFGGGVKYAAGKLFAALTMGSTDSNGLARDVIAWFVVSPTVSSGSVGGSIYAQGYVVPSAGYSISYPGFAVSKNGKAIIGMTITNPDKKVPGGFPSTAFIDFLGYAPTGNIIVTGPGATSDDGFSGYPGSGPAGVGRWGDYASAFVDPTTGYYWVANEFIPNTKKYPRGTYANWGTFITQAH